MSLIKESLHHSIDQMSDEEAETMLTLVKAFHEKTGGIELPLSVSAPASVRISMPETKAFKRVDAVSGKGAPASSLLIAERR